MADCRDRIEARLIPAGHPDHALALHLSLNVEPPGNSQAPMPLVLRSLQDAKRRGVRTDLLLGAYRGETLLAACLAMESPGGAATVFISDDLSTAANRRSPGAELRSTTLVREATTAVLEALQAAARERPIVLLEVLLDSASTTLAEALEAAGFRYLTRLLYLERTTGSGAASKRAARDLDWLSFKPELEPLFCTILDRTYVQSLDCPELPGLRPTADVLACHRAAGVFDPKLWWVAMRGEAPVGVLLLSRTPGERALEIVYLGVAQAARGTGVADALLERAVALGGRIGVKSLALAVDRRNGPALAMYARWDFKPIGAREAWIASPLG